MLEVVPKADDLAEVDLAIGELAKEFQTALRKSPIFPAGLVLRLICDVVGCLDPSLSLLGRTDESLYHSQRLQILQEWRLIVMEYPSQPDE